MTLLKADYNRYRFLGADQRFHTIYACPLPKLIELQDWLGELADAIAHSDTDSVQSFEDLYLCDDHIQALCHQILEVSGIKLEWVDFNHLVMLIHHCEQDGQIKPGLIRQLNRLDKPTEGTGENGGSIEDYEMALCSSLIGLGLAKDLNEAKAIVEAVPLDYLEGVVAARVDALKSPEQKKKEEIKKQAEAIHKENFAKIKDKGVSALFDDFMPKGFTQKFQPKSPQTPVNCTENPEG